MSIIIIEIVNNRAPELNTRPGKDKHLHNKPLLLKKLTHLSHAIKKL
jgi:hypothetical protein